MTTSKMSRIGKPKAKLNVKDEIKRINETPSSVVGYSRDLVEETVDTVNTEEIIVLPQVRKDFSSESISELAESIKLHGQLQPIVVLPKQRTEDGRIGYPLIAGERRYRACKFADIKINILIKNPKNKEITQLIENIQREDLTTFEIAEALNNAKEKYTFNNIDLAKQVNKRPEYVSRHLSLFKFSNEVQNIFKNSGTIDVSVWEIISSCMKINTSKTEDFIYSIDNKLSRNVAQSFKDSLLKKDGTKGKADHNEDAKLIDEQAKNLKPKVSTHDKLKKNTIQICVKIPSGEIGQIDLSSVNDQGEFKVNLDNGDSINIKSGCEIINISR